MSVVFSIVRLVSQCDEAGFSDLFFQIVANFYCSDMLATLKVNVTSDFYSIFQPRIRFFLYEMSFKLSFCVGFLKKSFLFSFFSPKVGVKQVFRPLVKGFSR